MLEFKAVGLEDADLFRSYLNQANSLSCEMNFANLFLWSPTTDSRFAEYCGRLVVVAPTEGIMFWPIGAWFEPEELAGIAAMLKSAGLTDGVIYDVPPEYVQAYPQSGDLFDIEQSLDTADYIYELEHLADLAGAKLRKKRNLVRQFERAYSDVRLGQITRENLAEFMALAERVFAGTEMTGSLESEMKVWPLVREYLFAPELRLESLTLSVDGQMIGFAIFSPLGSDGFDIHFEKIDHHLYKGAAQFFVQALAKALVGRGRYMNREQDLGIPGLRHAKESLDPAFLYKRCTLTLK